jgi:hypothetical protein
MWSETLAQELKVISDSYDLILHLSQRISKFPRQHRYGLGLSMEQRRQVFLALLIRAKYTSTIEEKRRMLQDANIELEGLRFQVQTANPDYAGYQGRFANEAEVDRFLQGIAAKQIGGNGDVQNKSAASDAKSETGPNKLLQQTGPA